MLDVLDVEVRDAAMQAPEPAAAMKHEGVLPETLGILVEA